MKTSKTSTTTRSGLASNQSSSSTLLYPPPLDPAYAYISASATIGKPTVLIDAGIHGNEQAPISAALQLQSQLLSQNDFGVILIPIANPIGYKNNTRYIDQNPDWDNYAHSVGDMGHLIGWQDKNVWRPPTNSPDNPYCKYLGEFALHICHTFDIRLVLDLHEDDHPNLTPGGYIYPIGSCPTKTTQKVLSIYKAANMPLLSNTTTRFTEPIINGVVKQIPNASFPELIIDRSKNCFGYTIETTQNQQFQKRADLHTAILKTLPDIMSLIA